MILHSNVTMSNVTISIQPIQSFQYKTKRKELEPPKVKGNTTITMFPPLSTTVMATIFPPEVGVTVSMCLSTCVSKAVI